MLHQAEIIQLVKSYLDKEYTTYINKLNNSNLLSLRSIYEEFFGKINDLSTILDTARKMIGEYKDRAYDELARKFYTIMKNEKLGTIIEYAIQLNVLSLNNHIY